MIERLVRSDLRGYAAYVPGTTVDQVRRRFGLERVIKLSSNENPLGTSPAALAAVRATTDLHLYEDRFDALELRLGELAGIDPEREAVVLGHGSNELLQLLFTVFVEPGDEVVFSVPSFSLYRKDASVARAHAIEVPLRDGRHDLAALLAAVTPATKMVILDDPNNPTATRMARSDVEAFARALDPDVLLVLDQAYFEYLDDGAVDGVRILHERPATIVLRTASKIYGLAAVRFGYALATREVASWLDRLRLPFNVTAAAAAAVLAAIGDREFVARSIATNAAGRARLEAAFAELGAHVFPSAANFVAVQTPRGPDGERMTATAAYEALLAEGVVVRSGDALGLPGYLRVTIGTPAEVDAFLDAYRRIGSAVVGASR